MDFLASDRIQIVLIYCLGFLVSRLFVRTGLADRVVMGLMRKVHGSPAHVSLFLLLSASLLSSFISNLITVLTLLPALKMLIERLTPQDATPSERRRTATYLACSLMWGANIGGNSSLIGSSSNLLLLGALEFFKVPGREDIGFLSWLLWGIPLTLTFDLLGWLLGLVIFGRLRTAQAPLPVPSQWSHRVRSAAWVSVAVVLFALTISTAGVLAKPSQAAGIAVNAIALLVSLGFVAVLFLKGPWTARMRLRTPLMRISDCWSQLPIRGLAFAGLVVLVLFGLAQWAESAGFNDWLQSWIRDQIPQGAPPMAALLTLATATIYLTEFLSNTLVATAFFYSADSLSSALGIAPLPLFVGIGMASTCAFMTPVATPVNSLAFGEIREISLWRMFLAGFFLNLLGAILVTLVAGMLMPAIVGLPVS